MKIGDLVNFHTDAWVFKHAESRYSNPGVILMIYSKTPVGQRSAEVYWSDGKITTEYDSYLRPAGVTTNEQICDP